MRRGLFFATTLVEIAPALRSGGRGPEGEAAIKEQQLIVQRERTNQAQRLNQAQAAEAEYKAIFASFANWIANSNAQPNVAALSSASASDTILDMSPFTPLG